MTLEEFSHGGGFVAFVPGQLSHVITRSRTWQERGPHGQIITHSGPETLTCEVIEGRRVVRLRSLQDFRDLRRGGGPHALDWERLNPHLIEAVAKAGRQNVHTIPEPPRP